jgi:hypothetical protein
MAHNGDTEIDRALEIVVAEINGLSEGHVIRPEFFGPSDVVFSTPRSAGCSTR